MLAEIGDRYVGTWDRFPEYSVVNESSIDNLLGRDYESKNRLELVDGDEKIVAYETLYSVDDTNPKRGVRHLKCSMTLPLLIRELGVWTPPQVFDTERNRLIEYGVQNVSEEVYDLSYHNRNIEIIPDEILSEISKRHVLDAFSCNALFGNFDLTVPNLYLSDAGKVYVCDYDYPRKFDSLETVVNNEYVDSLLGKIFRVLGVEMEEKITKEEFFSEIQELAEEVKKNEVYDELLHIAKKTDSFFNNKVDTNDFIPDSENPTPKAPSSMETLVRTHITEFSAYEPDSQTQ